MKALVMRTSDLFPQVLVDKVWHSVSRLVWDTDLMASRFILAMAEFIWAIILFVPGATFSSELSPHMLRVLPEVGWGFIFLLSSITQFAIILYEHMNLMWTKIFAMINAFLWMYLVFSVLVDSYPPIVGIAGEITLMLTAVWIWIRPYILAEGLYRAGIR